MLPAIIFINPCIVKMYLHQSICAFCVRCDAIVHYYIVSAGFVFIPFGRQTQLLFMNIEVRSSVNNHIGIEKPYY